MRTPVVVVTGVETTAMDSALVSLSWDLPRAVAVRHRIDPHAQVLTRTVSDAGGVLEQVETPLEHACVTCALREDILPTLERLARDDRWDSIVTGLPTATEAGQLTHALGRDGRIARHLRVSGVVAVLGAERAGHDLLSDDQLSERGLHLNPYDDRALGEVACGQVEFADVVVVDGDPGPDAAALVRALARPDAQVVTGVDRLDGPAITSLRHQHGRNAAWRWPSPGIELPALGRSRAWRLDLSTPRAFHPERLLEQIARLGSGRHRSRGTFWLPTRPGQAFEWSGAAGQVSIGGRGHGGAGRPAPTTRLVLTGLGRLPQDLVAAFEDLLVTPGEASRGPHGWDVVEDGLEPWLGDIRDVA